MKHQQQAIRSAAELLVNEAARQGLVLTIEQLPLQPLAMGHYATTVSVRQARHAPAVQQPRTSLEQYDLDQSPEYRKGWDAGRVKGYEVGYRHATEHATAKAQQPQAEAVPVEPTPVEDHLKLHAVEELCQLGYTVKDGELFPPDHLHKLMEAAGHPLSVRKGGTA